VGGSHHERAYFLVGRTGDVDERVEEAPQRLEARPLLDEACETFQRLAKRRVGLVGREVVASGRGLVPRGLLDFAELAEQAGLPRGLARRRELGAEPLDPRIAHGA